MEEDDSTEPPPPSAERVARRALILSVIACRGMTDVEQDPGSSDLSERSYDWLIQLGLEPELSAWERRILTTPFGSLEAKDQINAGWLSEGLTILAWALGKTDLPPFDSQCDAPEIANQLGFLEAREHTALFEPSLLSTEKISDYNEFIYNLHWRVRDYSRAKTYYDFEALARKAWGEPILRYGLRLLEKDVALKGSPLPEVSEADFHDLRSITQERHRASNWLIGYASEDFYEVTTDT